MKSPSLVLAFAVFVALPTAACRDEAGGASPDGPAPTATARPGRAAGEAGGSCRDQPPWCGEGLGCFEGLCYGADFPAPDTYYYTDQRKGDEERINELVIADLDLKPGMKVIDVGAGQGALTFPAACMVHPGGKVYATDIDPRVLATIEETGKQRPHQPCMSEAVETRLVKSERETAVDDLPPGSVSLILMLRVMTFAPDGRARDLPYLRSFLRLLKPGGRFIYAQDWVPDPDSREYVIGLFREAGFTADPEELPMPAHIPESTFVLDASDQRHTLYRGHILVFRKPG